MPRGSDITTWLRAACQTMTVALCSAWREPLNDAMVCLHDAFTVRMPCNSRHQDCSSDASQGGGVEFSVRCLTVSFRQTSVAPARLAELACTASTNLSRPSKLGKSHLAMRGSARISTPDAHGTSGVRSRSTVFAARRAVGPKTRPAMPYGLNPTTRAACNIIET